MSTLFCGTSGGPGMIRLSARCRQLAACRSVGQHHRRARRVGWRRDPGVETRFGEGRRGREGEGRMRCGQRARSPITSVENPAADQDQPSAKRHRIEAIRTRMRFAGLETSKSAAMRARMRLPDGPCRRIVRTAGQRILVGGHRPVRHAWRRPRCGGCRPRAMAIRSAAYASEATREAGGKRSTARGGPEPEVGQHPGKRKRGGIDRGPRAPAIGAATRARTPPRCAPAVFCARKPDSGRPRNSSFCPFGKLHAGMSRRICNELKALRKMAFGCKSRGLAAFEPGTVGGPAPMSFVVARPGRTTAYSVPVDQHLGTRRRVL